MATVTFEHVFKRYGDVTAVNDLNLEIQDEEFLVLVGPSGCGKTTALRMIAGLEDVTEGELKIGDRVVNGLAPKDRDVAMVFQSYALYPHMSVYDNLAFGLKLRKVPKAEIDRRVREAAATIELTNLLERKPKQLSGGQRQRVALARAIVREPAVFLMDEPLSNLDAKLRVQTRAEIARLHQRLRTTVVYVTHDQVEAMTMGDRIAVMNFGVLQQVGAPQELYQNPVNKFVAGFIGSPSMNFMNVAPKSDGGTLTLVGDGIELPVPDGLKNAVEGSAELTAGVRPEHFQITNGAAPGAGASVRATCDVVEFLGNEELLHVKVGGHDLVAVVGAEHRIRPGDVVDLFVPIDKIKSLQSESGIKVVTRPVVGVYYANLNHKVAPFDDVRVRQAISYAIDRESIVGLVLDGQGKPAVSLLASAFGDYNPDVEPYTYDPEKAKALLTEAGLEGGFETTYLNIAPPALFTRVAEVIQENLAAINVKIEIQSFPVAQWVTEGNSGKYGIAFSYYTYSDPDVLYLLAKSGAFFNFSWPTGLESDPALKFDDELDALLDQQRLTFDKEQRRDLLYQAQARINDQAHYVMLWEGVYAAAMKEDVQGLDIDLVGFIHLQELSR